jgi:hypothetical protein
VRFFMHVERKNTKKKRQRGHAGLGKSYLVLIWGCKYRPGSVQGLEFPAKNVRVHAVGVGRF